MKVCLPVNIKRFISFALILILCWSASFAQLVDITTNQSTSANNVFGTSLYAANECIYTEAEIGSGNFITPATAINLVAFNVTVVGSTTTFTNVTIWMKEVPLATTSFASGAYTTTGYTKVFDGSVNLAVVGWTQIPLTTPFQRTTGNNLQVLVERNDGVAHGGYTYRSTNGIIGNNAVTSSRRYNSTAPLSGSPSLAANAFRSMIRLQHIYSNDAQVQQVYTLGKLPIPFSTPHVIRANIVNVGVNALTNLPVTLNITGANSFTNVQTIPSLAAGASIDVSFAGFSPLTQGTNNIDVTIPTDDYNGNNIKSVTQSVNNNTFSYAYNTVLDGSAGFVVAPFTGDFVARYNTSVNSAISQVSVYFLTGGQPFQLGIWDATGAGGTPGNLLYTSSTQTSIAGVYVIPTLPAIPITAGDFFVGVRQIDVNNISFAYQFEDPIRTNTFYLTQPTGGTTWTDLAPVYRYRFMIEPKLQIPIDANLTRIITPSAACKTGPVNYAAVLSNVGLNTINAGSANVTIKIGGANSYTTTVTNATNIAAGTSETIQFNGINLNNPGTNNDTVFVTLAGDTEQANDTSKTTNISALATAITAFPASENVEASLPLFPNFAPVSGSSQLWLVKSGNYTNADQVGTLAPHGGNKFYLFDSYGGSTTSGFISRLYSNCVTIPANSGADCNYKLRFYMSHDKTAVRNLFDSLYVSVSADNGSTWTRLLPGYRRFDVSYNTPGWEKLEKDLSAYAGQTIQIGFEGVSKYGNSFGLDDISIGSIPAQELVLSSATNNGITLPRQCDDQGWTYYSSPLAPFAGLFAINWDPSNTGANVAAKAGSALTIQLDPANYAAEDIPGKKATYTMKRYWNLNTGASALTGPVNIRFFYDAAEKTAVDNAATAFATANSGTQETPTWFKTTGTDFAGDAIHVNPDGVVNAIPLTNVNSGNNTINGLLYAQFDGVTSFSGGTYAAGVGTNSPLPVSLFRFDAKRSGKTNEITWSTSSELNSKKFVIERSADGRSFSSIGEAAAAGNSNIIRNYSFSDQAPGNGINYYRLRMVDIDNSSKYSAIRSIRNEGSADITVYPNPAKALLNVKITADKADKAEVVITDVSGKVVATEMLIIMQGINLVPLNVNKFAPGSYILKITMSDDVVIRKFNKQ